MESTWREYGGSGEIPLAVAEEVIYLHEAIPAWDETIIPVSNLVFY